MIDTLDKLAEKFVPSGVHDFYHVDSRAEWIRIVSNLIGSGLIKPTQSNMVLLATNWEILLYKRLSSLN